MHAKPLLLLRLTGSNSEKKKVRQLHIVGKLSTTENLQSNTQKKNRCNCTFTPTGGHSTRRKNKWFEQWIQSWRDKVHWNDSFWQNYCHLEDLGKKKELFGRVQILTSSHLQWWCRMARSEAVDQLCCPRQRGSSGKKMGQLVSLF